MVITVFAYFKHYECSTEETFLLFAFASELLAGCMDIVIISVLLQRIKVILLREVNLVNSNNLEAILNNVFLSKK